jgi:hypothetical protein
VNLEKRYIRSRKIWTQSLRKELAEKIKEAVKTSFDRRTKDLLQTIRNRREHKKTLFVLFHSEDDGRTKKVCHRIDTADTLPIHQPRGGCPIKQA